MLPSSHDLVGKLEQGLMPQPQSHGSRKPINCSMEIPENQDRGRGAIGYTVRLGWVGLFTEPFSTACSMIFYLFKCFCCFVALLQSALGLSTDGKEAFLDGEALKTAILRGRVYQQESFLTESQVQIVLQEISQLEREKAFTRKGLSNTAAENTFDDKLDRSICPVPWLADALAGRDTRDIPKTIRQLQTTLSTVLDKPTIADPFSGHECYFSKSEVGSRLPRHMDSRHEELKGRQGWLLPSRRSISWLIYLSDPKEWSLAENGGALRSFPQKNVVESDSTHDGNLQVGWLIDDGVASRPVYLDSWFPVKKTNVFPDGSTFEHEESHCVLYGLDDSGEKEQLTRPWLTENLQGTPILDFLRIYALQDSKEGSSQVLFADRNIARQFKLLEDRQDWDEGNIPYGSEIVDVVPTRGSLVVFDSVKLPHQVQTIRSGTRLALAGFFHEEVVMNLPGMQN